MPDEFKTHVLEVWGDFACFSRPELSVERFSYPCPSPSAARGILEAIYFKPQFRWHVTRIELLAPFGWDECRQWAPSYIALRRNEVKDKANERAVKGWMRGGEVEPLSADADKATLGTDQKGRTQRQTMALRNPRFRIHANIVPRPGAEREQAAYDEQLIRRASQGKCFHQPALGCREFVAFFRLITDFAAEPAPANYSQDLGWMVYDVFDLDTDNHALIWDAEKEQPIEDGWQNIHAAISVFRAKIVRGVLDIPAYESDLVRKPAAV